jgi:YHS domain-containing protein
MKANKMKNKMKTLLSGLAAILVLSSAALAGDLVNVSGESRVAVSGYDPVAFFTDSKPVNGSPFITADYKGATYFFATEEHKTLFTGSPEKYVPQYGGFCAYGVSVDKLFPIDISTWQIRDGKLYLNLNKSVLKKFNADFSENVAKAEKNWPDLVATHGK